MPLPVAVGLPAILGFVVKLGVLNAALVIIGWLGLAWVSFVGVQAALDGVYIYLRSSGALGGIGHFALWSLAAARLDDVIAILVSFVTVKLGYLGLRRLVVGAS